jgi:ABC-2 type transport system ATP-binding protein
MKQKVLISIAIARNTPMLIFDEPTANLDKEGRERFIALLRQCDAEKSIIFISHRVEDIADLVTRKITMDMGRIVEDEKI